MSNVFARTYSILILLAMQALAAVPTPVTTITLGPQPPFTSPQQMAANPGTNRLYVFSGSQGGFSLPASIAIINTATNAYLGSLQPSLAASFLPVNLAGAFDGRNAVAGVAANQGANKLYAGYNAGSNGTIVVLDSTTDTITQSAAVAGGIANLAFNPATNKLYVMQLTAAGASTQILVLDGATLAQLSVISGVENGPLLVNPANNKIYTAAPGNHLVVTDSTRDLAIASIAMPVDTYDLLLDTVNNNVYAKPNSIASSTDLTVYEIDGSLDQLAATINSPLSAVSFGVAFGLFNPAANRIYSGSWAIDGASNAVSQGLPGFTFGSTPPVTCQQTTGFTADFSSGNMFAGCDGTLLIADLSSGTIRAQVPVSYARTWGQMLVHPASHLVYAICTSGNSVAVLDPVGQTASLIQMGNLAAGIAANATTNRIYVADVSSSAAIVIDGATNNVLSKVFVQNSARINQGYFIDGVSAMSVNPVTNRYIVGGSDSATELDGTTNTPVVVTTPQLVVNGQNNAIGFATPAVNTSTNKMYTTDFSSNIFVTDLATGAQSYFTTPFLKAGDICTLRGMTINIAQNWVYATAVCQIASPKLFIYDGATAAVLQSIDLGAFMPTGSNVGEVLLNPKTNKIYIGNYGGFNVQLGGSVPPATEVFNAVTIAHLASIPDVTGPFAIDTVLNATYGLWTNTPAGGGSNTAAVVDGATDTLNSSFPLGFVISSVPPNGIAANEATHMIYYVNQGLGQVSVYQGNLPSPGTFSISGRVIAGNGAGISGITVSAQAGVNASAVTGANGQFTLAGLPPATYTVAPAAAGYFFGPASQSVTITTASITGVIFTGLTTPVSLTSLSTALAMIGPGVSTTDTVSLNQPAPFGGLTLAITASNKALSVPATVTVAAGATSATFSVKGNSVSSPTAVTLTVTYQGPFAPQPSSVSASLTVAPTDKLKVLSATWSRSSQILSVTATSSNPQAILTVFLASNNQNLGTMTNNGGGNYGLQVLFNTGTPASINVKSNLGGSTGTGVTVTP